MTAILHGLDKACYSVNQTLNILSIGRTSLYALVKRGDLMPLKIGKKTLFTAENISALLNRLRDAAMAARSRSAQDSNRSETRS
jgi:hypothetical protein